MSQLPAEIFKAYDIRGIVNKSLTADVVRQVGHALGSLAVEQGQKAIAVGRDGRLSGPELAGALMDGICAAGIDAIDVGCVPTPLTYFAAYELGCNSCVSVTGSHNPPDYNGLKMVIGGTTLALEAIQDLKKRIEALAATAPSSLGPTGASSLLASLREIEGELSALRRGLSTVENQAREARDREEQRQTFDKKIADTRASLDVHIKELETKSAELDETEKILAEIAAAPPAGPKEKDRKAAQRRYGDTQQQLKSRVQRLRELIDEGRRKLDEPFEYRPSTSAVTSSGTGRPAGAAFVPAAGADDDLRAPTDPLPSVGRLVVAGKQRYLGIQRWEDLDVAEQEAARLSAHLVAEVAAP